MHAKYEVPISYGSTVIVKVKVDNRRTNRKVSLTIDDGSVVSVGPELGCSDGTVEGASLGLVEGLVEGCALGLVLRLGFSEGWELGFAVRVGLAEGWELGLVEREGPSEGLIARKEKEGGVRAQVEA